MRKIRQFHFYLGVFFAPLIILFAVSGALQTFRLQEEKGWGGQPPAWIEYIASIHKDSKLPRAEAPQTEHDEAAVKGPGGATAEAAKPVKPKPPGVNKLPMQVFLVAMSVGLMLSAFLGIAIAINNRTTRRLSIIMLAAGTILPIILLKLA
jgi:hypothetical protein